VIGVFRSPTFYVPTTRGSAARRVTRVGSARNKVAAIDDVRQGDLNADEVNEVASEKR